MTTADLLQSFYFIYDQVDGDSCPVSHAQLAAMVWSIQERKELTRAYTPGNEVEQVELPHDTIPTRLQTPESSQTRGPPESP